MKKFKILVIDNQAGIRTSFEQILEANDFSVQTVANSSEVVNLLLKEVYDLVFIGFDLPAHLGLLACREIKSNVDWSGIPVIFIIDTDNLCNVNEIYESGGDDYIIKPVIRSELMMKANLHLELKYSRQMANNMNQILETKIAQRTIELEDSLKKLRQAKKELEILDIAKSEFLNLISHEIRTPLNGILGSLQLIERYKLPDEVNRYFSLLDFSVKRLEKFSITILEASTLRIKGEKALTLIETDLYEVLQDSMNQCIEKYREKNISVDFQNKTTNSLLEGDPNYLLKCFYAVLENGFKFSPRGEKIEISIINDSDGYLKTTIADRGDGFSKASIDHIFSALSNLEGHFDQNTGMGLHMAKLIIDAHSGRILVANRHPNGAKVEIYLPQKH